MKTLSGDPAILVVEDEYFLADDVARALSEAGASVVGPVPTAEEAVDLLKAGAIDFALLDINLRGQRVYQVADELLRRQIPFMFATGYDQSQIPEPYRGVPRLEKPFSVSQLIATIDQQMAAPRPAT
jgi:CheY-like chemotaxis protein